MNDNTLQYLRQLIDKQGRPLIELGRDGLTGTQSATHVRRFAEAQLLIEAGLIGFEEWARFDSALVSGNTSYVPAAVLQQHS